MVQRPAAAGVLQQDQLQRRLVDRRMSNSRSPLPVLDAELACCPPLAHEPLSADQAELIAPLLKALADPVRLRLISMVLSSEGGEACVCDLTGGFDLSQPTISHHLKVLHEAGLLDRSKRGVWVYYRARSSAMAALGALLAPGTTREVVG
jgi:ArsR family transcriptional regulator